MSSGEPILTARLALLPLTAQQLIKYLAGEDLTQEGLPAISKAILTPLLQRAIGMKIEKLAAAPAADQLWITYWLIQVLADGHGAGMIGYKGAPDAHGEIEIGYGIDPAYRSKGYTTEAVLALINWAFQDPRCRRVIAPNTRRDNPASNRVLEKCGFSIYRETAEAVYWCLDQKDFQTGYE